MKVTDIELFFTAADTNHNGKLTQKEMKKAIGSQSTDVQKFLNTFLNEKGKIDKSKFNLVAQGDGNITKEELLGLLTTTDEDDNIELVDDETLDTRLKNTTSLSAIDTNSDGKFTQKEILKAYNKAVTENNKELQTMLEPYITTNKKGKKVVDSSFFKMLSNGTSYLKAEDFYKYETDESEIKNAEYKDSFTALDTSGDGKITAKEILKLYNNAATSTETKALLENFITKNAKGKASVDMKKIKVLSDGKKYLTLNDLKKIKTEDKATFSPEELKSYYDAKGEYLELDTNGNGQVTLSELKKTAKKTNQYAFANYINSLVSSKEQKRVFKLLSGGKSYLTNNDVMKYDTNGDGTFSADEIKAMNKSIGGILMPA